MVTDPAQLERGRAMLEAELTAMDAACSPGSELPGSELAAAVMWSWRGPWRNGAAGAVSG